MVFRPNREHLEKMRQGREKYYAARRAKKEEGMVVAAAPEGRLREDVAPNTKIVQKVEVVDRTAEFEEIQSRLLKELERRTKDTKGMGLDEIGSLLKTCRENLQAIAQAKVTDHASTIQVVTQLDFEEEKEGKVQ